MLVYYSRKLDANSLVVDALKQTWSYKQFSSSIFIGTQITKKSIIRECSIFYSDSTNVAESDMIPRVFLQVYKNSYTLSSNTTFFNEPLCGNTCTSSKSNKQFTKVD